MNENIPGVIRRIFKFSQLELSQIIFMQKVYSEY